ncbi:hypothetical protein F0562_027889 [Nyssa sinensis]|uniref:Uncharacterized protein n=1 Tax=Nyssa sinensis TaxID=561372 RepID=A0A5J5B6N5_9ASTE|nr:hypothetical protein F0562_027889 [Nyssa sinensis]
MALTDPKVFMEAMLSEMWHVMKLELEQIHERIDHMESARERQPQNVPNLRRRERVQPWEVRVEDEEPYGAGFDEEDDQDSVVGQKQFSLSLHDLYCASTSLSPSSSSTSAQRVFPDRLSSLVAGFDDKKDDKGGPDQLIESGEELETFQPDGSGLDQEFDEDYDDDDGKSDGQLDLRVRQKPDKEAVASVSVSEIIAADEKRSDHEYEPGKLRKRKNLNVE